MKYKLSQLLTKVKKIQFIKKSKKFNHKKNLKYARSIGQVHLIYRLSDAGYPKEKPEYISNENCLRNAMKEFPVEACDWIIIADNCGEQTLQMVNKLMIQFNMKKTCLEIVSIGSGGGTFNLAYRKALEFNNNDIVYFLENDYLHKNDSFNVLCSAFLIKEKIDYVTLYDHPYHYADDFLLSKFNSKSKVYCNNYSHWKKSPSTTMTFAAQVHTLKKDRKTFYKWTSDKHAFDIEIFIELAKKHRVLISPIPGFSTHGETKYLSMFTDWRNIN